MSSHSRNTRRFETAPLLTVIVCSLTSLAPCSTLAIDRTADARAPLATISDLTDNQRSLARYLDSVCRRDGGATVSGADELSAACSDLRDPLTTDGQARAALDAVDPAPLIGAANTALELAALQNKTVMQRIASLRAGAQGVDFGNLSVQVGDTRLTGDSMNAVSKPIVGPIIDKVLDGVANIGDFGERLGVFANGNVRDGGPLLAGSRLDSQVNLTTGVDYRVRNGLAVGASAGYTSLDLRQDPTRGDLAVESWRGSLFGTYFAGDVFHLDGLLTYGIDGYDSTRVVRPVDALGGSSAVAKGATNGRQLSGQLTGAFDLKQGPFAFGPHVGAHYLDAAVGGFGESGAGAFDYRVGDQSAQSLRVNAGAHVGLALRTPWGVIVPNANADYVHDLQDRATRVDVGLLDDPLAGVTDASLRTLRPDGGYFVWSIGASARLAQAITGFITYRTIAGIADALSTELTWGIKFEAKPFFRATERSRSVRD